MEVSKDNFVLLSNIMVPMRDAVRLATDVYLPATSGAFPIILERTPYDKNSPSRSERSVADPIPLSRAAVASFFASHGYAFVYQDCRGTHHSEGAFTKYLSEGEDGFDTIDWIAKQPWCDGNVGTMGLSYAAHTQVAAACLAPSALKAMFVDSGGFHDAYQGGIRQGGAFELKQATWAMKQAIQSPQAQSDPSIKTALEAEFNDIFAWFGALPWKKGQSPVRWLPEYEDYLFEQWTHGNYDEFWKKLGICASAYMDNFANIPMVHMSSWFDPYPRTATENYQDLRRQAKGPLTLILGPWTHGDRCLSYAGDVEFGPQAPLEGNLALNFLEFRLRWFDRWLKNMRNGVEAEPRITYFRMGGGTGRKTPEGRMYHGGKWCRAQDWPIPNIQKRTFFLCSEGSLSEEGPGETTSISYRYDPGNPVPSIGGAITSGEPIMKGGAFDQVEDGRFFGCHPPYLPLSARKDVLVFETAPLSEDCEVTGAIEAELWVSSDCLDTDFTIKLIDVYPPNSDYPRGFAMNLTDGILRARYRDSWEQPSLLEPGRIYRIEVKAFPTSNLFAKGHKIRLDISSSNFPHFDVNPNTGGPEGIDRNWRIATNMLHLGIAYPSRLFLPIVPTEA